MRFVLVVKWVVGWLLIMGCMLSSTLMAQAPSEGESPSDGDSPSGRSGSDNEVMGTIPDADPHRIGSGAEALSEGSPADSTSTRQGQGEELLRQVVNVKEKVDGYSHTLDMVWFVDSDGGVPYERVRREVESIIKLLGSNKYNVDLKILIYGHRDQFDQSWRSKMQKLMAKYFGDESLFQVLDVVPDESGKALHVKHTRALEHAMIWLGTLENSVPLKYKHATGVTFFRDDSESSKIFVFVTSDDSKKYPPPKKGFFSRLALIVAVATLFISGQLIALKYALGAAVGTGAWRLAHENHMRKQNRKAYENLMKANKYGPHINAGHFIETLKAKFFGSHSKNDLEKSPYKDIDTWAFVGGGAGGEMNFSDGGCKVERSKSKKVVHFTNYYNQTIKYNIKPDDITGARGDLNTEEKCRALRSHHLGTGKLSCPDVVHQKNELGASFRGAPNCSVMCEVSSERLKDEFVKKLKKDHPYLDASDIQEHLKIFESKFINEINETGKDPKQCRVKRTNPDTFRSKSQKKRSGLGFYGNTEESHGFTDAMVPFNLNFLAYEGKVYIRNHFKLAPGICIAGKKARSDSENAHHCRELPNSSSSRINNKSFYHRWATALSRDQKPPVCLKVCSEGEELYDRNCRVRRPGNEYIKVKDETGGVSAELCGVDWADAYEKYRGLGQFSKDFGLTKHNTSFPMDKTVGEVVSIKIIHKNPRENFIINSTKNSEILDLINNPKTPSIIGKRIVLPIAGYISEDDCELIKDPKLGLSDSKSWSEYGKALGLPYCFKGKEKQRKNPVNVEVVYKKYVAK